MLMLTQTQQSDVKILMSTSEYLGALDLQEFLLTTQLLSADVKFQLISAFKAFKEAKA